MMVYGLPPAATVIIPLLRQMDSWLGRSLWSALDQTVPVEVIVVTSDATPSSNIQILAEAKAARPDLLVRERPAGARFAGALNHGIRSASADRVGFLLSDDWLHPQAVERCLAEEADIVSTGREFYAEDGKTVLTALRRRKTNEEYATIGPLHERAEYLGYFFLFRRKSLEAVGGVDETLGDSPGVDDFDMIWRLLENGATATVVPEFLYNIRDHAGERLTLRNRDDMLATFHRILDRHHVDAALRERLVSRSSHWFGRPILEAHEDLERTNRLSIKTPRARKRLLILTPYLPYPALTGGRIRSWQMARSLTKKNDVTLVTFVTPSERHLLGEEARRQLHRWAVVDYSGEPLPNTRDLPPCVGRYFRAPLQRALFDLRVARYDAAIVDSIYMSCYAPELETNLVLTEHNIESTLLAQSSHGEAEMLRAYEDRAWPTFPLRAATSEVDAVLMRRRCAGGRTIVVENGTDPSIALSEPRSDRNAVLFMGTLNYFPNVDGVLRLFHDIWPHLRRRRPAVRLLIAGRSPAPEVRALDGRNDVQVIADPMDMREIAKQASLSVVPLRIGSGTRIKILDSFALGLPVVSTAIGAEGLDVADGEHLLVRDSPEEFAEACDDVLRNGEMWRQLHLAGRELAVDRYNWSRIYERFETALRDHLS